MAIKRIQNRVAESRYTLPASIMTAFVIWYLAGLTAVPLYLSFAATLLTTYTLVEINNGNSLLRIYSRTVSSSFILLLSGATFLLPNLTAMAVTLCYTLFCLYLFRVYQEKEAPGGVFHAFLFLGIASIFFIQIAFLVPFLWILMTFNLMAMSHRNFWASVLGLITPYWFAIPFWLYKKDIESVVNHFVQIADFQELFQYEQIPLTYLLTFAFIVMIALFGIIHFLRKSFMDKIRTRMLYTFFIVMTILLVVFIVLQPQHDEILLPLLIVHVSPLFAHYLSLTNTRLTNITFFLLIILWVALTVYNLWNFSPIF